VSYSFRGDDLEAARVRGDEFDPIREGEKYRLSPAVSRAIWDHALRESTDARGTCDEALAQSCFHDLASRVAARGGRLVPDVGKLTRVGVELFGEGRPEMLHGGLALRVPGRTTLVIAEGTRWQEGRGATGAPIASVSSEVADGEASVAADDAAEQVTHQAS